jgi:hypothetical protein
MSSPVTLAFYRCDAAPSQAAASESSHRRNRVGARHDRHCVRELRPEKRHPLPTLVY